MIAPARLLMTRPTCVLRYARRRDPRLPTGRDKRVALLIRRRRRTAARRANAPLFVVVRVRLRQQIHRERRDRRGTSAL